MITGYCWGGSLHGQVLCQPYGSYFENKITSSLVEWYGDPTPELSWWQRKILGWMGLSGLLNRKLPPASAVTERYELKVVNFNGGRLYLFVCRACSAAYEKITDGEIHAIYLAAGKAVWCRNPEALYLR